MITSKQEFRNQMESLYCLIFSGKSTSSKEVRKIIMDMVQFSRTEAYEIMVSEKSK